MERSHYITQLYALVGKLTELLKFTAPYQVCFYTGSILSEILRYWGHETSSNETKTKNKTEKQSRKNLCSKKDQLLKHRHGRDFLSIFLMCHLNLTLDANYCGQK